MRQISLKKSAFALSLLASALLVACGGGGTSDALPAAGQVTNSVSPANPAVVAAGQSLTIVSNATAYAEAFASHTWAVSQLSGPTASAPPTVADALCEDATVVPHVGTVRGAGSAAGTSTCVTQVVVSLGTPTSTWAVSNNARTTSGAASGQFTLTVLAQPDPGQGFGLAVSDLPQLATVGQPVGLTGNYVNATDSVPDSGVGFVWTQVSGEPVVMAGANSQRMTFIPAVAGEYAFKVTATATFNTVVQTRAATMVAIVGEADYNAPAFELSAGGVQASLAGTSVTLSGSVSDVPEGGTMAYKWQQIAGPGTTLFNDSTLTPQFIPGTAGDYVFELQATLTGARPVTRTSRTLVSVVEPSTEGSFAISAGDSQVVGPAPAAAILGGSVNTVNLDQSAISYQWTQVSGLSVTIANANSLQASMAASAVGLYVFELAATYNGNTKRTTTSVLVK